MYALYLIVGFSVGILGGFFGIGGAFILTPLLHILGISMVNAVATGLAFTLAVSTLGGIKHYFAGNVSLKIVLYVGFISLLGVSVSQPLVIHMEKLNVADFYIRSAFIILLVLFGILTLLPQKKGSSEGNTHSIMEKLKKIPPLVELEPGEHISFWILLAISLFVGFLKGFLGVGGGFVLVPLFMLVMNLKPSKAAGTSLMVLTISSIYAVALYLLSGMVLFTVLALLVLGSLLGVNIGVTATGNIKGNLHRKAYGLLLLVMAAGILFKHLGLESLAVYYTLGLVLVTSMTVFFKYYVKFRFFPYGKP